MCACDKRKAGASRHSTAPAGPSPLVPRIWHPCPPSAFTPAPRAAALALTTECPSGFSNITCWNLISSFHDTNFVVSLNYRTRLMESPPNSGAQRTQTFLSPPLPSPSITAVQSTLTDSTQKCLLKWVIPFHEASPWLAGRRHLSLEWLNQSPVLVPQSFSRPSTEALSLTRTHRHWQKPEE